MEDNGEELVNLAPMRVRRDSVQSTIADCKFFSFSLGLEN